MFTSFGTSFTFHSILSVSLSSSSSVQFILHLSSLFRPGFKHLFNWRESCFWSTFLSLQFRINTSSLTSFFLHPSPTHFSLRVFASKFTFHSSCALHIPTLFLPKNSALLRVKLRTLSVGNISLLFSSLSIFLTRIFPFTLHSSLPSHLLFLVLHSASPC